MQINEIQLGSLSVTFLFRKGWSFTMLEEIPLDSREKSGSALIKALDLARPRKEFSAELNKQASDQLDTLTLLQEQRSQAEVSLFDAHLNQTSFLAKIKQKLAQETFRSIDDAVPKKAKETLREVVNALKACNEIKRFDHVLRYTIKVFNEKPNYSNDDAFYKYTNEIQRYRDLISRDWQSFEQRNLQGNVWSENLLSRKKDFVEQHLNKAIDEYLYLFTSLTGLNETDWQCLGERTSQKPFPIAVYATNAEIRKKILSKPEDDGKDGNIIESIKRLGKMGIRCHAQLMLYPAINDGAILDQSIKELAALRPAVQSIGIVPPWFPIPKLTEKSYIQQEANALIDQIEQHQRTFVKDDPEGNPFVYLADQWYLLAKRDPPPAEHYGSYDHIEQGIGQVRFHLDELENALKNFSCSIDKSHRVTIATGGMAEPILDQLAQGVRKKAPRLNVQVIPIGTPKAVTGLLTGEQILKDLLALKENETIGDIVLLKSSILRYEDNKCFVGYKNEETDRDIDRETFRKTLFPARVEFVKDFYGAVNAIQSLENMEKEKR